MLRIAAGSAVAGPLLLSAQPARAAADAYDVLRLRWRDLLTGSGFDPAAEPYATALRGLGGRAGAVYATMAPAAGSLWPDLPLGSVSANITGSYVRLRTMALAWAQPGTGLTGDAGLGAAIAAGLDHLRAGAYTPTATAYGNWWDWQIGAPQALLDTCVLAYEVLTAAALSGQLASVDRQVPDARVAAYTGTSTGANRVDLCRVLALRGVLGRSSAKLATAAGALSPVFPYVRSGDGLYADGSFVQHTWVPYTGSYGEVMLGGLSKLFALLAGSAWQITDPQRQTVFDSVGAAYAPFLYNGLVMDSVSGRAPSRGLQSADLLQLQQDDHGRGHTIIGHILRLADSGAAPAAQSAGWRAAVKGWITRDRYRPYLTNAAVDLPELARAQRLLADASVTASGEPAGARVFAMDRAVVRRAGWAASLSLCSARTTFYETGNGENLRGWHTNNGLLAWWGADYGNGQYSDAFWPTVDPYRLPGTTVSRTPLADAAGGAWGAARPAAVWAGGATDGSYAAVGQDVRGLSSTLSGRKSWFLLDDSVVCLGAGISCADGVPVETVVDNRNLGAAGTHALTVDGVRQPDALGWSGRLAGVRSLAIAGFGGYVFPGGATVNAARQERTGSWHDVNVNGSTQALTRRYLTVWFDHGTDPAGAAYSYLLMPGAGADAAAARAAAPTVTVLANTVSAQAISDSASGVTAANFFAAGTAGPVTVSAPASVLLRESAGELAITVCDPSRASATVTVTVARAGCLEAQAGPGVTVLSVDGAVRLLVEVGGTQGAGRTVTLRRSGTPAGAVASALAPTRDSYLRDGAYGDTNYGTATALTVKNTNSAGSGFGRRALLGFDTSAVPGTVRRAVLWMYGAVADSGGTQTSLQAFATGGEAWTETAVTWNRSPSLGSALGSGRISGTADWVGLDVTAVVAAAVGGELTLAVWQPLGAVGLAVNLNSRESTAHQPFLEVISS
ncbi:polysaccharide lyase family 8 super-sandwich domain-containing protein [Kitasatospora herbaricolor]|uniref:DNRLRE domain-containing protein n=1 Tax=Kitasatospora herbaricolor TaxID=68217 RepID=A0ABZ1WHU2_9ACTN|nr:polysaccharide lyase family 8 super-sandwich domain-containing protein [Kitasatospora herbaricolor]